MFAAVAVFFFIIQGSFGAVIKAGGCAISVNGDLGEPQPLVLSPSPNDYASIVLPEDNTGLITLPLGGTLTLSCPNSNLLLDGVSTGLETATATCVSGTIFQVAGRGNVAFSSITCTSYPFHTARYTGRSCDGGYSEIEVGFEVDGEFLVNMVTCFDSDGQDVKWSRFNLTKAIGGYQVGFPRPSWIQGNFYTVGSPNVNTLYTRATQRVTINNLVGLEEGSFKYVAETSDYFLARGHLTAKADYVFGAQHRLTFYFVNAAPQWQTFNGGNWNTLEGNVRNFASNKQLDLIVYTGTWGVTTLPHEKTGADVEIYLYDNGSKKGLAVPKIYWKLVYEPKTKAAVVFVGVNNPYESYGKSVICKNDVIGEVDWLTVNANDQKLGYMYACTYDEFRQTVDYVPVLDVRSLLV